MDTTSLPLISGDSHVAEPRFLWYDNLPASMRERAPRTIVPTDDGSWDLEGHDTSTSARRLEHETAE
jgi:hypothetical protein